jgi:hypothetical protein
MGCGLARRRQRLEPHRERRLSCVMVMSSSPLQASYKTHVEFTRKMSCFGCNDLANIFSTPLKCPLDE